MKSNTGKNYKADNTGWSWRPRSDKYNEFKELTPERAKKLFGNHPKRTAGESS